MLKAVATEQLETKLPKIDEKILFIFIDPEDSGRVVVLKDKNTDLFGFDYLPKSGSINQNIFNHLLQFKLVGEKDAYILNKFICVYDQIDKDTVYRVYLYTDKLKLLPNSLDYVKVKKLTCKSNPKSKLYLSIFLKVFSSLELISYFK